MATMFKKSDMRQGAKPVDPDKAKIKSQDFERECIGTARTLSRNFMASVEFSGDQAATSGNRIVLPSLPEDVMLTKRQARVARGFVDHESAHQSYTDMSMMNHAIEVSKARGVKNLPGLLNAVEDVRIEARRIKEYPGSKQNLEATCDAVAERFLEKKEAGDEVWSNRDSIMGLALVWSGRKALGYNSPKVDECLGRLDPAIKAEAEAWNEAIINGKTTWDSWATTKKIGLGKSPDDDDDEGGDTRGGKKGKDEGDDGTGPRGKDEGNEGGKGEDDSDGPGRKNVGELAEFEPNNAEMLEEDAGDVVNREWSNLKGARKGWTTFTRADDKEHTRHDAENRYGTNKECNYGYYRIARTRHEGRLRTTADYESQRSEIASTVNVMRTKFQRMLMAMMKRKWNRNLEDGYLDSKRLVAAASGKESNVFKLRGNTPSLNTAVVMLVDMSGSMHGSRVMLASQAVIAMSEILEPAGIPFEVLGFNDCSNFWREETKLMLRRQGGPHGAMKKYNRVFPVDHYVFKSFREGLREARPAISAINDCVAGQNCDGEAVLWAGNRLAKRGEARRIFLVLSDGYPAFSTNSAHKAHSHLRNAVAMQAEKGIECIGIGIQSDAVKQYYEKSVVVDGLSDLPVVVMGEMSRILLGDRGVKASKALINASDKGSLRRGRL